MDTHDIITHPKEGGYVMLVAGPPRADIIACFKSLRYHGCSSRFDPKINSWKLWLPFGGAVEFYRTHLAPLKEATSPAQWAQAEMAFDHLEAVTRKFGEQSDGWMYRLAPLVERLQAAGDPLHDYQTQGAYLVGRLFYGLLNDEQGMGKTRTIAVLLSCLQTWPVVVITKASCKYGWLDEIAHVDPSLRVQVLEPKTVPDPTAQIYVLNYDLMPRKAKLLTRQPIGVTIFDESHEMLNTKTKRGQWSLVYAYAAQRCYLVTGTPMPNRPLDILHQLKLMRSPVAVEGWLYRQRYCDGKEKSIEDEKTGKKHTIIDARGVSNFEELQLILGGLSLRRTKDQFLDLPPKDRVYERILFPAHHSYWEVHQKLRRARGDVAKLQAIGMAIAASAIGKVPYTAKLIRGHLAAGRKVVVFSGAIAAADALHAEFPTALRLTGGMDGERRKIIQDAFQKDPKHRLIICSLKSSGAGINLQAASIAIFNDLPWSPDITQQAEDRIHRIGQELPCQAIYVLAKHSFDDLRMMILNKKALLQAALARSLERTSDIRVEQSMLFG